MQNHDSMDRHPPCNLLIFLLHSVVGALLMHYPEITHRQALLKQSFDFYDLRRLPLRR